MAEPVEKIYFSREQYEYLSKIFPEVLGTPNTTLAEFQNQAGKRVVLNFIAQRVK